MPDSPDRSRVSDDAALVLALAGTAVPFADSPEAEAEAWLRILRMHGAVGSVLQALGVGEDPLSAAPRPGSDRARRRRGGDSIASVVEAQARDSARDRGTGSIGTPDVLFAVMTVYGRIFDRALEAYGTTRDEVLERLAAERILPAHPLTAT